MGQGIPTKGDLIVGLRANTVLPLLDTDLQRYSVFKDMTGVHLNI